MQTTLERIGAPKGFIYDPNLILYLPLHQLDGVSFADRSAYGHLATATGALWALQGRSFDGSDDVINCGSADILDTAFGGDTTGAYTYEWWAKHTTWTGDRGLLNKGNDPVFWGIWTHELTGNRLYWAIKVVNGTSNLLFVNWVISENTTAFNHFVLVGSGRAAAGWTLYVNGVAKTMTIDTNTLSGNVANAAANLFAPGRAWGNADYFHGILGELRVYNRALTLAEVWHNYLATKWRYQ